MQADRYSVMIRDDGHDDWRVHLHDVDLRTARDMQDYLRCNSIRLSNVQIHKLSRAPRDAA